MMHHIMIAAGLSMAAIFSFQAAMALQSPGFGWRELYVLGGLILAAAIIRHGLIARRAVKARKKSTQTHT